MKANELRIGNYIQREDLASRELRFEQVLELCDKVTTTGPVKVVCDYNDIKPIPLTEQWLLDFGFKKINGKYFRVGFQLKAVKVIDDIGYHFKREGLSIEIKHVHQLQNLYFALTGEELTKK